MYPIKTPLKMPLAFLAVISFFSCSKDADLLSDYVIAKDNDLQSIALLVDDSFFMAPGQNEIVMDVLNNDSFGANTQVKIIETSMPNNGEVVINADNTLTYTPQVQVPTQPATTPDVSTTPAAQEDSFTYTTEVTVDDNSTYREEATVTVNPENVKAFPSAFGGGSNATGGRGKALAIINTLDRNAKLTYYPASGNNDEYYTGGLFAAMQEEKVGYIVFNVSGNIDVGVGGTNSQFGYYGIPNVNNKTIFGQSAPEGGITITGGMFKIDGRGENSKNLILRYFRSRPVKDKNGNVSLEDDAHTWGLHISGGENVIVDHCSFSFGHDKAVGGVSPGTSDRLRNVTFSNNLIADSHTGYFISASATSDPGIENTIDKISILRNLSVGVNRTPNLGFSGIAEIVNNISYAYPWKATSTLHGLKLNQINNYYHTTSETGGYNRVMTYVPTPEKTKIYSIGNILHGPKKNIQPSNDQKSIWVEESIAGPIPLSSNFMVSTAFNLNSPSLEPIPASNLIDDLINGRKVGANEYLDNNGFAKTYIDSFDDKMYSYVLGKLSYSFMNRNNWVLPSIPQNTRPMNYDSDNDGMADAWEIRVFGNLNQSYRGDFDGDGYENIEEYMNQVDF